MSLQIRALRSREPSRARRGVEAGTRHADRAACSAPTGLRIGSRRSHLRGAGHGSQISAVDVETGRLETISAKGGEIVAPDDLAFDARGDLYVTEVMDARVSVLGVDGRTRVLRDDVPGANGITFHQGRLFIDECRIGGRLLELDLARRRAARAAREPAAAQRDGGRARRLLVLPVDGSQRDLARSSRRRRAPSAWPATWGCRTP